MDCRKETAFLEAPFDLIVVLTQKRLQIRQG
jgi:hypothetical protein